MARLTGPLMSVDASGSIAGALTFAKWKGRNYVRQLVTPANPKSPAQTAFRAMFGFLARQWARLETVDPGSQASWDDLAEAGNYSPFNAYVRYNQDIWGRFLPPMTDPAGGGGSTGSPTNLNAVAGVKSILLTMDGAEDANTWGVVIYRKAGGAPSQLQTEVVAIIQNENGSAMSYQDLGLTPGTTYHYVIRPFSRAGGWGTAPAAVSATPT